MRIKKIDKFPEIPGPQKNIFTFSFSARKSFAAFKQVAGLTSCTPNAGLGQFPFGVKRAQGQVPIMYGLNFIQYDCGPSLNAAGKMLIEVFFVQHDGAVGINKSFRILNLA